METLLAGLGSEIRETLHNLIGMLELIREEPLSDNQSQYLARCQAGADHLMTAANDVLELVRSETPTYAFQPFRLKEAVDEIASVMQLLAESRGQQLNWSFDESLPPSILGDQRLLQDTLRRLMVSALDRAPAGRVDLSVERGEGQTLVAEVIGANNEEAKHDPVEATLALRIIQKRLGFFDGTLAAKVDAGRLSIRLELPFHLPTAAATAKLPQRIARESDDSPIPPLNLLVAEDSDDSFYLLQAYVTSQGHKLTRASDGAKAVEMAKSGNYDFVFMDVKMPVMDGYTASRLIREWETEQGRPRLPILLLSADEASRQMRLGASVGCSGYLTKPASRTQVLAALNFYARPAETK